MRKPSFLKRRSGTAADSGTGGDTQPRADKLELLSAMDIFQDLSEQEVEALMDAAPMRTAPAGVVFYAVDDGPEVLFLLKSGRVELSRRSADGKKLTLAIVEPGTFFGEMSLVGQRLMGTHATAIEYSMICAMSRDDLRALIQDHPSVAMRLMERLAERLQEAREDLQEMAFNDVTGRVANLLQRLSEEETNVVEGYSHQDLAAMVGCLRESLTVTLDRFKTSEAVTLARKRIVITDRGHLERLVSQRSGRPRRPVLDRLT